MGDAGRDGSEATREPEDEAGENASLADRITNAPVEPDSAPRADNDASAPPPAAADIRLAVSGKTDVGLVREHNEDTFLVADLATGRTDPASLTGLGEAGCLFAVCDGMGGAAAGEVASQMAVDTVLSALRESTPASDRDGFALALVRAVERAGAKIFESANDDRSRRGMGTTATVAALMDKTLFVGQVGDSRAYVLRGGELKLLTKDQSLVNQLIEAGQLTEDEAEAFEHSNIILQALGTTDQVSVDLTFLELRRGDRLMLCSDGLSGLIHADVIREVMTEVDDLSDCCDRLIELAKAGGGHDNITVIVVDFDGEGLTEPADTDLAGYQQYPLPFDASTDASSSLQDNGSSAFDVGAANYSDRDDLSEPGNGLMRYMAVTLALLALAFGVYYWSGGVSGEDSAEPEGTLEASEDEPVAAVAEEPHPVEVVVRTDVEGSELHVDGASYGAPDGDKWMLDLPPGPHRLEARSGGSVVASSLVTVREGIPATVFLSMPEVGGEKSEAETEAASAGTTGAPSDEDTAFSLAKKRRIERHKARAERRRKAEATEAETEATSPSGTATPTEAAPKSGSKPAAKPATEPAIEP